RRSSSTCAFRRRAANCRTPRGCGSSAATSRASRPSPRRSAPPPRPRTEHMPKRVLQGVVVSDKQEKTLVVKVERRFTHPLLKKTVRRSKNYHAHVENKTQKVGDTVSIEETKPISKLKRWIVIDEAAQKAPEAAPAPT